MDIRILPTPTPAVARLVETHTAFCDATAPAESCHRLPVSALFGPAITVWGVFDPALIGIGALHQFSASEGEVKSMHTLAEARGQGVARALLQTIIAEARSRGLASLSLETGVHPDFSAARGLYARTGFAECGPFGDYVTDPHSIFMTLHLPAEAAP